MPVNVSVSWDEENSPRLLGCCWGATQFVFLLMGFLVKIQLLHSSALMRPDNPQWARILGFFVYVLVMITGALYLNLIVNGIWHKNPDNSDPVGPATGDMEVGSSHPEGETLEAPTPNAVTKLFEQSILKNPDPIIRRDKIQWKRMFLATGAMSTLVLSWAALF